MMSHDDVSREEQEVLFGEDEEARRQAELAVMKRQIEFNNMWNDTEFRRKAFQQAYLKDADFSKPQTATELFDAQEVDETFVGVNEQGDLVETKYEDCEEWRHQRQELSNGLTPAMIRLQAGLTRNIGGLPSAPTRQQDSQTDS
jgi:hypothetical protein